jgi:hypothetical protein
MAASWGRPNFTRRRSAEISSPRLTGDKSGVSSYIGSCRSRLKVCFSASFFRRRVSAMRSPSKVVNFSTSSKMRRTVVCCRFRNCLTGQRSFFYNSIERQHRIETLCGGNINERYIMTHLRKREPMTHLVQEL